MPDQQGWDEFQKGFRKATGADADENAGQSGQSAWQSAKDALGAVATGAGNAAGSAAEALGLKKKQDQK